jgi:hypothetical protein
MPVILESLIVHDEVATDETALAVARYLEVWQRSGSREQASAAAWEQHRMQLADELGHQPFVAREQAPGDVGARIVALDGGGLIDVVVGVEHDLIEILLGARDCVQCEIGVRREHAQDALRPRMAMLRVWQGTRAGRALASQYVSVPDLVSALRGAERITDGLPERIVFPLSQPFGSPDRQMDALFTGHLQAWARDVGALGLAEFFDEPQHGRPSLIVPAGAVEAEMRIAFPSDSLFEPVYSEAVLFEVIELPVRLDVPGRLWLPPAEGPGAAGQHSGGGPSADASGEPVRSSDAREPAFGRPPGASSTGRSTGTSSAGG